MANFNSKANKLLDILLFPKEFYGRLTGSKKSLIPGIIFVGLMDIGLGLYNNYKILFINRTERDLIINIILSIAFIIGMGIIDIFFFSFPLFDLFKHFENGDNLKADNTLLVKLMKVYVTAHLALLPLELIVFFVYNSMENNINILLMNFIFLLVLIIPIWFASAIFRGVNVLYNFNPVYRGITFAAIFIWNYILSIAFEYMINNWLMRLFII